KNDKMAYLPPTVLTQLAQPSAPRNTVDAIIARIDAGARPRPGEIYGELRLARERERELARHVRRGERRRKRAPLTPEEREKAEAIEQREQKKLKQEGSSASQCFCSAP